MDDLAPHTVVAPDGIRYYSPSLAARMLDRTSRQIESLVEQRQLGTTQDPLLLKQLSGPGRRPRYLVPAEDIDRMRRELLDRLGVAEELEQLKLELASAREAWEQETLELLTRATRLEEANRAILEAVEQRLVASTAHLQADRQFLLALRAQLEVRQP